MARPRREWHDDQLFCRGHKAWHHHTRFRRRERVSPQGSVWIYDADCKTWQQTQRVDSKHEDEALRIVESRARQIVTKANKQARAEGSEMISLDFMMGAMNWRALVPTIRACIVWPDESVCPNCASHYDTPVEFDHREPPRHARDWARHHARNIGPLCKNCNGSKNNRAYAESLDLEEAKRVDCAAHLRRLAEGRPLPAPTKPEMPGQLDLFNSNHHPNKELPMSDVNVPVPDDDEPVEPDDDELVEPDDDEPA